MSLPLFVLTLTWLLREATVSATEHVHFEYCPNDVQFAALINEDISDTTAYWYEPRVANSAAGVATTVSQTYAQGDYRFSASRVVVTYTATSNSSIDANRIASCQLQLYVIGQVPADKYYTCTNTQYAASAHSGDGAAENGKAKNGSTAVIALVVDRGNHTVIDTDKYNYELTGVVIQAVYTTPVFTKHHIDCYVDIYFAEKGGKKGSRSTKQQAWRILAIAAFGGVIIAFFERVYFYVTFQRKYKPLNMQALIEDESEEESMSNSLSELGSEETKLLDAATDNVTIDAVLSGTPCISRRYSSQVSHDSLPPIPRRKRSASLSVASVSQRRYSPAPLYPLQKPDPMHVYQRRERRRNSSVAAAAVLSAATSASAPREYSPTRHVPVASGPRFQAVGRPVAGGRPLPVHGHFAVPVAATGGRQPGAVLVNAGTGVRVGMPLGRVPVAGMHAVAGAQPHSHALGSQRLLATGTTVGPGIDPAESWDITTGERSALSTSFGSPSSQLDATL